MTAFVAVRLGAQCPECLGHQPLNRIESKVLCRTCLSTFDVDWPGNLFSRGWSDAPRTWPLGKRDHAVNALLPVKLEVQRVGEAPAGAPVRQADATVQYVFPGASRVFDESPGGDIRDEATRPLVTACMSCGAGLRIDGASRVVECAYCKDSNYLPDALWLRLHPTLKRRWLVLAYD